MALWPDRFDDGDKRQVVKDVGKKVIMVLP